MKKPAVYMIAGPNGAGKTTSAMKLLPDFLSVYEFVNADEIARGLSPLNRDAQAMFAGRLMLERIDQLVADKKSFAFETTGASKIFAEKLKNAKANGYHIGLIYLWLPSSDLAKERVRLRAEQGGHNIPAETIERRYDRGLANIVSLYLPISDDAVIMDSTLPVTGEYDKIAEKSAGHLHVFKSEIWQTIETTSRETSND